MTKDLHKNKAAVDIFDRLAEVYQSKFMDVSMYSKSFDFFCDSLNKVGSSVLDLGCGPGNITKYLLDKRPDFNLLGIDLAPNMVQLAIANNPNAQFRVLDGRQINTIEASFDGIICGFLLPYLNKEETFNLLADAVEKLEEDGWLYLSTMEGKYHLSSWKKGSAGDEIFMHFHEHDYLVDHLKSLNCAIVLVERFEYLLGDEPTVDLVLVCQKTNASPVLS